MQMNQSALQTPPTAKQNVALAEFVETVTANALASL